MELKDHKWTKEKPTKAGFCLFRKGGNSKGGKIVQRGGNLYFFWFGKYIWLESALGFEYCFIPDPDEP